VPSPNHKARRLPLSSVSSNIPTTLLLLQSNARKIDRSFVACGTIGLEPQATRCPGGGPPTPHRIVKLPTELDCNHIHNHGSYNMESNIDGNTRNQIQCQPRVGYISSQLEGARQLVGIRETHSTLNSARPPPGAQSADGAAGGGLGQLVPDGAPNSRPDHIQNSIFHAHWRRRVLGGCSCGGCRLLGAGAGGCSSDGGLGGGLGWARALLCC